MMCRVAMRGSVIPRIHTYCVASKFFSIVGPFFVCMCVVCVWICACQPARVHSSAQARRHML